MPGLSTTAAISPDDLERILQPLVDRVKTLESQLKALKNEGYATIDMSDYPNAIIHFMAPDDSLTSTLELYGDPYETYGIKYIIPATESENNYRAMLWDEDGSVPV